MARKLDAGLRNAQSTDGAGLAQAFGGSNNGETDRKTRKQTRRRLSREYRERKLEGMKYNPLADCNDGL